MKPEIIKMDKTAPDAEALAVAADAVRSGKVVMFPADTCYGLAINPLDHGAEQKLNAIKMRPEDKRYSMIFKNIRQIKKWTVLNMGQEDILRANLPGPFTFLLDPSRDYPLMNKPHSADSDVGIKVGVRIPNFILTRSFSKILDIPYTATSANISGQPPCWSVPEFLKQIEAVPNNEGPALILDAGELPRVDTSTVVDITQATPIIIRHGNSRQKFDPRTKYPGV